MQADKSPTAVDLAPGLALDANLLKKRLHIMAAAPNLPPALVTAIQEQRAILFLGAGASFDAKHPKKLRIPLGDDLRDKICDQFLGGALKNRPLAAVAAMAGNEVGLTHFQKYIRDLFKDFGPSDTHMLIPTFRWRAIVTTNFDLIIERAYEKSRASIQHVVKSWKDG
jgi:hypothetical protein